MWLDILTRDIIRAYIICIIFISNKYKLSIRIFYLSFVCKVDKVNCPF